MPSTESIIRAYTMEDLEMLEKSQVFHNHYVIDEALFTAAFTHFGLTYAADFQAIIDAADAIPSGDEVESDIVYVTSQIEEKMVLAREAVQKLFTYVDIAFKKPAKTQKFGKYLYNKARNSHRTMKELLERAHRKASETANQTALLAAGYTAGDIAELLTLMNDIDALNVEQEDLKDDRGDKSQIRILAYNAVWAYMEELNQASKVVFASDPAKLTQYLLYPTVHHSLAKPQNLTAVLDAVDPLKVNIDFDPVPDALEYHLYKSIVTVGDPSGTFTDDGTSATNHFDAPLITGKRNYWKVKAYNDTESSSDYSDEVWLDA